MTGDLEELPGLLVELRGLVREAHGAAKDLNRAIREARQLGAELAEQSRAAAQQAAAAEMKRFETHIQGEMDRSARDLNKAVVAARVQVVKALTVKSLRETPGGQVEATFAGDLFDAGPPADR